MLERTVAWGIETCLDRGMTGAENEGWHDECMEYAHPGKQKISWIILLDLAIQGVLQPIRIVLWDSHRFHVGALDIERVKTLSAVVREGCLSGTSDLRYWRVTKFMPEQFASRPSLALGLHYSLYYCRSVAGWTHQLEAGVAVASQVGRC